MLADQPVNDGQSGPPRGMPAGSAKAGGLWVAEDVAEMQEERRTHPLYRKLSSMNGEVNAMSRGQLKQRLRELGLEPR